MDASQQATDTRGEWLSPSRVEEHVNPPFRNQHWMLAAMAAGIMLLIVWVFSPRYAYWAALAVPDLNRYPETHRAADTLLQLTNPFRDVDNFSNRVIEWRLLFPIVFHYLRLPPILFLAMPWVGCLLVLWYAARLVWGSTKRSAYTAAALVLIGTTSWFFTSTGWLTYFDSWYILGALVIAFGKSRWSVFAAAVLTPWIDERIVFMLPACLMTRAVMHWYNTGRVLPDTREWKMFAAAGLPLACYALMRAAAVLWFDAGSSEYYEFVKERAYPVWGLAEGAWMGLRLAWLPVFAAPLLIGRRCRPLAGALAIVTVASIALAIVIAGDTSRSMSMLIPIALVGILLASRFRADSERILLILAAGNLLLPAAHVVVATFTNPIFSARYELHRLESPPPELDARVHFVNGVQFAQRGDTARAARALMYARQLARGQPELPAALAEAADVEHKAGRVESAAFLYRQALDAGSPDWPDAARVQARLREISAVPPQTNDKSPAQ